MASDRAVNFEKRAQFRIEQVDLAVGPHAFQLSTGPGRKYAKYPKLRLTKNSVSSVHHYEVSQHFALIILQWHAGKTLGAERD